MKRLVWLAAGLTAITLSLWAGAWPRQDDPFRRPVKHERWSIKTGVPEGCDLVAPKHLDLADLINLQKLPGVPNCKPKDKAFDSKRYPAFPCPLRIKEGDLISTSGWLHLVASESDDGDFHVQISPSQSDGNNCMIVEVPNPDDEAVKDPDLQRRYEFVRSFLKSKLKGGREPAGAGSLIKPACFIRVTGVLFFDSSHVKKDGGMQDRGKRRMKAATLWELHPLVDATDDKPTISR